MNKNYRSIWNEALGAWVAVSEIENAKGKPAGGSRDINRSFKRFERIKASLRVIPLLVCMTFSFSGNAYAAIAFSSVKDGVVDNSGAEIAQVDDKGNGASILNYKNPGNLSYADPTRSGEAGGKLYSPAKTIAEGIAIGRYANAATKGHVGVQGYGNIAIGDYAQSRSGSSLAFGSFAKAINTGATSIGTASLASGFNALAMMRQAAATDDYAMAIGTVAWARGKGSLAMGHSAQANGHQSIAIGSAHVIPSSVSNRAITEFDGKTNTQANGKNAIAIGSQGRAEKDDSIAIGTSARAVQSGNIAIGQNAIAEGVGNVSSAKADRKNIRAENYGPAIAIGGAASAQGRNALAIGNGAQVTGDQDGIALGASSSATTRQALAVGYGANATHALSVALGSDSETADVDNTNRHKAKVNNLEYSGFAGVMPISTVSIGKVGRERTITNVAAGLINSNSTDAINGSQLYATQLSIDKLAASTANYLGGNAAVRLDGSLVAPTYTINKTDGSAYDVANNVEQALQNLNQEVIKPLTFTGNSGNSTARKLGNNLEISGGLTNVSQTSSNSNIRTVVSEGKIDIQIADTPQFGNVKINDEGNGRISGVSTPIQNDDAANKAYVDGVRTQINSDDHSVKIVETDKNGAKVYDLSIDTSSLAKNDGSNIRFQYTADGNSAGSNLQNTSTAFKGTAGEIITTASDGQITFKLADEVKNDIAASKAGVAENKNQLANNTQAIKTNSDKIGANTALIETNTGKIAENTKTIENSLGKIAENTKVITANTEKINQGLNFAGDQGAQFKRELGQTIAIKGADLNISTIAENNQIKIKLIENINLGDSGSVTTGKTVVDNKGVTVKPENGDVISLTSDGLSNGGKKITKVAEGQAADDAVNKGQLDKVQTLAGQGWNVQANESAAQKVAPGATVTFKDGKNIKITQDGTNLTVATADDLTANSITLGEVKIDGKDGINAGGKTITNVAKGNVAANSNDAVNGSQLHNTANSIASILGGGSKVNPDGTINTPEYTINGGNYKDVGSALSALNTEVVKPLTFVGDNNDVKVARKLGSELAVKGGATGNLTDKNIGITGDVNGGLTVKLAENINLGRAGSVTAGNTVIDNDGVKITPIGAKQAVSLTSDGLNNGGNKITNVAAGNVIVGSQEAVNGSQFYAQGDGVKNIIGGQTVYNPKSGTYINASIGDTGASNIDEAIRIVKNAVNKGWELTAQGENSSTVAPGETVDLTNNDKNIVIKKTAASDIVNFDLARDLSVDSITVAAGHRLGSDGLTIKNGPTVTKAGINAGGKKLSNISSGEIQVDSREAVNGGQIRSIADSIKNVFGGSASVQPDGTIISRDIGGTGKTNVDDVVRHIAQGFQLYTTVSEGEVSGNVSTAVKPGETFTIDAGKNIKLTQDGKTVRIATRNHASFDSVVAGKGNDAVTLDGNGVKVNGKVYVSNAGLDANNQTIANMAAGKQNSDAVNVSQLKPFIQALGMPVDLVTGLPAAPQWEVTKSDGNRYAAASTIQGVLDNIGKEIQKPIRFAGNSGHADKKLGDTLSIRGGLDEMASASDKNIRTKVGTDSMMAIELAESPQFGKVTINAGNTGKITGVTAGIEDTDAVNMAQLKDANNIAYGSMQVLGGAYNSTDNMYTAPSFTTKAADGAQKQAVGTVQEALGSLNDEIVKPITFRADNGKDSKRVLGTTLTIKAGNYAGASSSDNLLTSSDGDGTIIIKLADAPKFKGKISAKGLDVGNEKITGVAAGEQGNDAVNVNQLRKALEDVQVENLSLVEANSPFSYVNGAHEQLIRKVDEKGKAYFLRAKDNTRYEGSDIIVSALNAVDPQTAVATRVTNVATGTDSNDAVNVGQLKKAVSALGGGAKVSADGSIKDPVYSILRADGTVASTVGNVGDALKELNMTMQAPIIVSGNTNNGSSTTVAGGSDQKLGSKLQIKGAFDKGESSADNIRTVVTDGTVEIQIADAPVFKGKVSAKGFDAGGERITNVADATVESDAVNLKQLREVVTASSNKVGEGKNIKVVAEKNADGSTTYNIGTKDDVTFNSVEVGKGANHVTLNDKGVSVAGNTYITGNGIQANDQKITGLAAGNVHADSRDAINGTQLFNASQNIANALGGSATVDANGNLTAPTYTLTGSNPAESTTKVYGNVGEALKGISDAVNQPLTFAADSGRNVERKLGSTIKVTGDGSNIRTETTAEGLKVALNDNITVKQVQVTDGPIINSNGIVMNNQQITSLKSGLEGRSIEEIKAEGSNSKQWNNAATVGDLASVQNNVVNITNVTNNILGTKDNNGNLYTNEKGELTKDGKLALTTYDVSGQTATDNNTVISAIKNMNEGGIKYFHTNDDSGQKIGGAVHDTEDSSASGKFATAVGFNAAANSENALAIGKGAKALAENALAIGTGNIVTGRNSGAIGDPSTISGNNSYSLGNNNNVITDNTFVLGNSVTQTLANSVVLGNGSAAIEVHKTAEGSNYTYRGVNDANVAGVKDVVGVVSVGKDGQTRQIQNVAAGVVSATSTDAINGSQLYYTNKAIEEVKTGGSGIVQYSNADTPTQTNGGKATNDVTLLGGNPNAPVVIHNVGAGSAPTDAVNVGQLMAVGNHLNQRIEDTGRRANAGTASAMAMAGLPQAYLPGKSMVAVAGSTYRGESGYALGVSSISDNGNWIIKGTASGNSRGHYGATAGVGYQW
ncbi:autotransporter NhhA [Neisseria animaloris]|uniref:YadA-like family protein n=1 Tax=Neisseria animaloris TaxID=326522 RepID=UPI000A1912F0|nr:YadA-like family protein [Neisseria animaloris]OSI07108.1 hypothetical protein BWD08_08875 [Neisseria animaloris]VEH87984.1 autotransporter NhhA [Neisseria animaloris]